MLINVTHPSKWKECIAAHPAKEAALEEVKKSEVVADDVDAAASASNCENKAMRKRTLIPPKMWRDRIANSDIGTFPDSNGEVYYGLCYPGKSGAGNRTASAGECSCNSPDVPTIDPPTFVQSPPVNKEGTKATDRWIVDRNVLIRVHNTTRSDAFHPDEDEEGCPFDVTTLAPTHLTYAFD